MADIFELVGKISLDGIDRAEKDLNSLSDTGEKSASKLGKLGGIAKTVGKGILIGAGAVVTGTAGLVKQVSSSWGELQQSIGGIETLFGAGGKSLEEYAKSVGKTSSEAKDEYDKLITTQNKVIENANNAYTTAGISANEYMQQVTSFSASLLQSVGGDTEKAAEYANRAVIDMADNANKMGTSMEDIQHAYQGFSKQNYTMLDNLKLGYGGTKSEMERLIKDASKLTEVQEKLGVTVDKNDMSFGNIVNAISVMQESMGIAGTTLNEAEGTIEGSFNSLSASWQNFIAGLGNPDADMAKIVDNLAKGLNGAIHNVIPVINNMVSVLPTVMDAIIGAVNDLAPTFIETFTTLITQVIDGIVKLLPTLIPMVVDTLRSVIDALVANLPQIINAVILLVTEVINALSEMLPELIPTVIQALVDISNSLLENLPTILNAVLQMILGIADGLIEAMPILINALPQIIDGIVQFLVSATPMLVEASIQLFMALVQAVPVIMEALIPAIPQIVMTLINGLMQLQVQFFKASIQFFMALLDGLKTVIPATIEYMPKFINGIIDVVKQLPGKLAQYWGEILDTVKSFFGNFISKASEGAKGFVDKIKTFVSELPEKMGYWLGFVLGKVVKFALEFPAKAKEAGQNFVNSLINFIKNLPTNIHNLLSNVITNVVNWGTNLMTAGRNSAVQLCDAVINGVRNLPTTIMNLGKDIVTGLWNGITNAKDWLVGKISGFASGVVDGFKGAFGIHSPSRVMAELGGYITQGLGVGITDDDSAEKAIDEKVNGILNTANNSLNNIKLGTSVDGMIGESPMQKYQLDFNAQIGALNDGFDRLIGLVGNYLPNISENMNRPLLVDGNNLATSISKQMDNQLGRMAISKGRGNV